MAGKLGDKISLILNSKSKIQTAIVECGVSVPATVPFNLYSEYIKRIMNVAETSDMQDLFQICDIVKEIGTDKYVDYTYEESEINQTEELLNYIIEEE